MWAGCHLRLVPSRRTGSASTTERREEACLDQARLAAAAGTDHSHEPAARTRRAQSGNQSLDELLPAKEVGSVGLLESAKAFVWILQLGRSLQRTRLDPAQRLKEVLDKRPDVVTGPSSWWPT